MKVFPEQYHGFFKKVVCLYLRIAKRPHMLHSFHYFRGVDDYATVLLTMTATMARTATMTMTLTLTLMMMMMMVMMMMVMMTMMMM